MFFVYLYSFQVNYLSTSLLALLLLPRMVETAKNYEVTPRIVVVTSEVHYWAKIDKAILEAPNPLKAYGSLDNFTPKCVSHGFSYVVRVGALNRNLERKVTDTRRRNVSMHSFSFRNTQAY